MAWERSIPFGYRMEQAKIICEDAEAETVRKIFSDYLTGCSLGQIANSLSAQSIRYHEQTPVWNKNMVKRILENDRYIGNADYPQLVRPEDFLAVRLLKADKCHPMEPCPDSLKAMSQITVCAMCGAKMRRHTSSRKRTRWVCQNDDCRETAIIEDEEYLAGVDQCIRRLTLSPQLLDVISAQPSSLGMDALRLQNELTAAFNRGTESSDYMKMLIYAFAAEKYNALPDVTIQHKAKALQGLLKNKPNDMDHIREQAVQRVLLRRGAGVAVELINGAIITGREETVQ